MRQIIKPTRLDDLCFGIDLQAYFMDDSHLKLVECEKDSLFRTGDKVVYGDKLVPIYEAKIKTYEERGN